MPRYELEHPSYYQVNLWEKANNKKLGEITIRPGSVEWKIGHKGAYLHHYVPMDKFIEWMNKNPVR
jgi:hypothetical protein